MIHLKRKILFFALVLYSVPAMAGGSNLHPHPKPRYTLECLRPDNQVLQSITKPPFSSLQAFAVACAQNQQQQCSDGQCKACWSKDGKIIEKYCLSVAAIGPQGHSGASKSSKSKAGKPNTKNTKCDPLRETCNIEKPKPLH